MFSMGNDTSFDSHNAVILSGAKNPDGLLYAYGILRLMPQDDWNLLLYHRFYPLCLFIGYLDRLFVFAF